MMKPTDYLSVKYDAARTPYGPYPSRLARHLHETWLQKAGTLLDVGCGRGEYLDAFAKCGHETAGVDLLPTAASYAPGRRIELADLENEPMPYPSASFDFAFSKSLVEHLRKPVVVLEKVRAALRPGGIAIIMTPSWAHSYWGPFYLDHTHVTPFTVPSLRDCLQLAGFEPITVQHIRQLPFLWRYRWAEPFVAAFSKIPLPYRPMNDVNWPQSINKFIRFSKEAMVIGVARRPVGSNESA